MRNTISKAITAFQSGTITKDECDIVFKEIKERQPIDIAISIELLTKREIDNDLYFFEKIIKEGYIYWSLLARK